MKKAKTAPAAVIKNRTAPAAVTKIKASERSAGGPQVDLVRELARVATEFDLAEIEVDPLGRVRIARRAAGGAGQAVHHAPGPVGVPTMSLVPASVEPPADAIYVSSPFVGTFYKSPSPEAGPFVDVGQTVRKGQVICIIEAMKLMNEIESEADGKVVEVLVKNGDQVEYGQHLFRLQKA